MKPSRMESANRIYCFGVIRIENHKHSFCEHFEKAMRQAVALLQYTRVNLMLKRIKWTKER